MNCKLSRDENKRNCMVEYGEEKVITQGIDISGFGNYYSKACLNNLY